MENEIEKYSKLLERVKASTKPVVLVNACTHGHETVGLEVIKALKNIVPKKGTLILNVANEKAVTQNTAFTESDLNRIFPGQSDGTYEEKLAQLILPVVNRCDVVVDIHSTGTVDPGKDSMLIVTKLNDSTKKIIDAIAPPKVLLMEYKNENALISSAQIGIGFEYGTNEHPLTLAWTVRDIKKILQYLNMIPAEDLGVFDQKLQQYRVFGVLPKKHGMEIDKNIQSYQLVTKGQQIGTDGDTLMYAEQDFVPILFGKNRYQDIFGFMGEEL
jgi:succinylglutamate desuccinylase